MLTDEQAYELARDADLDWQAGWNLEEVNRYTTLANLALERYARAAIAAQPTGGSPEHLLQDQDRGLSRWLSNQPDAPLHAREAAAAIAAQPAPEAGPVAPFLFLAMDDDKRAHLTWCATEAEVEAAVALAMFWLQPGENLSSDHEEQLAANVAELLDSGALTFEGDPPLYLYRVAAAPVAQQGAEPLAHPLPERDTKLTDRAQGVFRKFNVTRTDGSSEPGGKHHGCSYFVLDVDHDPCAAPALKAYADAVEATHPVLAADMRDRYGLAAAHAQQPAALTDAQRERAASLLDGFDSLIATAEMNGDGYGEGYAKAMRAMFCELLDAAGIPEATQAPTTDTGEQR